MHIQPGAYLADGRRDSDPKDWAYILGGESFSHFVEFVTALYRDNPSASRNDYLRGEFNSLVGIIGERRFSGLDEFYGDPRGKLTRMQAYELGDENVLQRLISHKGKIWQEPEYAFAYGLTLSRFSRVDMLDHGCGLCHVGLTAAVMGAHVTFHDYDTYVRQYVRWISCVYLKRDIFERLRFNLFKAHEEVAFPSPVNLVVSMDVLEHCLDPVEELKRIHDCMSPGGVLLMGTFFNSCNGEDPQHLDEHAKFQDTALWLSVVDDAGFELVGNDPRGVPKIWIKRP